MTARLPTLELCCIFSNSYTDIFTFKLVHCKHIILFSSIVLFCSGLHAAREESLLTASYICLQNCTIDFSLHVHSYLIWELFLKQQHKGKENVCQSFKAPSFSTRPFMQVSVEKTNVWQKHTNVPKRMWRQLCYLVFKSRHNTLWQNLVITSSMVKRR